MVSGETCSIRSMLSTGPWHRWQATPDTTCWLWLK